MCTHTRAPKVIQKVKSEGFFLASFTARPDKEVQGLSMHNGRIDQDISQTPTLDLLGKKMFSQRSGFTFYTPALTADLSLWSPLSQTPNYMQG